MANHKFEGVRAPTPTIASARAPGTPPDTTPRLPGAARAGAALMALVLAGCAAPPQAPVALAGDLFTPTGGRIGVAMAELPKPDTGFPGASCLLCIGVAAMANSALTDAVRTWSADELLPLKADLVKALRARGLEPVLIDTPLSMASFAERSSPEPNTAKRDFSALRQPNQIDRVLVVQVDSLGVMRNYASYVPTGAPRAALRGAAYIVELGSHKLSWYLPLAIDRVADGTWDEPPKFPGLANAYYQVLESTKDQVGGAFKP